MIAKKAAARPQKIQTEYTYEQLTLKYKFVAWLYFPLQYLIIRCLTLGIELTPTIEQLYKGFNLGGIFDVCKDFLSNIQGVFTAEHFAFIVFNLLPYALRLSLALLPLAAFIYSFYTLIIFFIAQISILQHNRSINLNNIITVMTGPPGSGKSSSAGYKAVIMARIMFAELQYKYKIMLPQVQNYLKEGNAQKLLEWYEVRDSYEYYMTHDCIPCLWSNIPLQVGGQKSSILTYEHAAQVERVPYYSVLYFDETGSVFRVDSWRDKPLTVSDFFRLARHFGEFRILCTEQDPTNIFKDVRRVVAQNILMQSQKWVNKPWLFLIPYKILKTIIIKSDKIPGKTAAVLMERFNLLIAHIGQRRYKYVNKQNTEAELKINNKKRERTKIFYLPTMLNYQYNERTFKNLYLAKDKLIPDDCIFTELCLSDTEENRKRYLKAIDPNKKQKLNAEEEEAA